MRMLGSPPDDVGISDNGLHRLYPNGLVRLCDRPRTGTCPDNAALEIDLLESGEVVG